MSFIPENSYQFYKGPEGAPLLLLLPGMACSGQVFAEGLPCFLRHFSVVTLNNPGTAGAPLDFGQGHATLDVKHIATVAKAVVEKVLAEELTADTKLYVLGHSMGGFVGQTLAHEWPEKVAKLVLMSTCEGGPANDRSLTHFWTQMTVENAAGKRVLSQHDEGIFAMMLATGADEHDIKEIQTFFHNQPQMNEHALLKHYLCGARFASFMFIRKLACPTLVIHGDSDRVIPLDVAHDMAEQLPNARMWVVGGAGHMPFWQRPTVFERAADFLLGDDTVGEPVKQTMPPDPFTMQQNQLWFGMRQHITSLNTLLHAWGF